jgi:hypothetical protein
MKRWVEWIEPFSPLTDSAPVFMRVEDVVAIKFMKAQAEARGHRCGSDEQALEDFKTTHWAILTEEEESS